jgi:hypothetical protein
VQNPQIFRGPAAPRPRLQRCLRRLPPPRILISTELVTMHLTVGGVLRFLSVSPRSWAKNQPTHMWWQQWGKSTPALQFVAMSDRRK